MTSRDIRSLTSPAISLGPQARTATANGSTVDLLGFESAVFHAIFGTWTDGTHTPSAQDSPDGTTWTTVPAANLSGAFTAISSAGGSNTVQQVGYAGSQRYVRLVMTVSGATNGAASSGMVVRAHPAQQPAN